MGAGPPGRGGAGGGVARWPDGAAPARPDSDFHLLLAGALQIYVRVGDDDLLVAMLGDQGELVGLPTALPRDRLGPL